MKQSLQLKLGQSLTMTPQLQQAIKLLQLPTIELQNEIQQILDSNPLLEMDDEPVRGAVGVSTENTAQEPEKEAAPDQLPLNDYDNRSADTQNDTAIVSEWDDEWTTSYSISSGNSGQDYDEREFYETQDLESANLRDHLHWQLNLTQMSDTDRAIATAIIDAINEDGYLNEDLEVIYATLGKELDIEYEEVQAVLHRVQHFDPIGVGARNLSECLLLQLETYSPETPDLGLAKCIIQAHLELLAAHDYARLRRHTNSDDHSLRNAEALIQCLNPKPGAAITSSHTEYIVPDVFVSKKNSVWQVELNPDLAPRLRINSLYAGMIKRADRSDDNTYLKNNLQEARWFLKSLQSRNETILKVAANIVQRQRAFFEYGDEAMKPMVLRDIAETLEMHESTISRVTNQKYMHTPRGIYEFKYFFSSHVGTVDGGECSATAIRAIIKKLVAAENPVKPLSDSKIAALLAKQGVTVARRTIAKYRESLHIPPSNERKRLI